MQTHLEDKSRMLEDKVCVIAIQIVSTFLNLPTRTDCSFFFYQL